jgi:hypothetical protein
MSKTRISSRSALIVCALLCLLVPSSAVAAGTPANVTVRVEGVNETKVPPTLVTTTTAPVVKDGSPADECSGTSALGALELATSGNWSGPWSSSLHQYFIETIEGEGETVGSSKYYWSFWANDKYEEEGACVMQPQPGDRLLFFPVCYEACPVGPEPTPLEIEAPSSANAGEAVTVTVVQYNAKGEAKPAVGANVGGGGTGVVTDAQGHATLKFFGDATYTLRVSGAESTPAIRTETTICIHEGNDGTCGTQPPSKGTVPPPGSSAPGQTEAGAHALVATAGGVIDKHVYSRRHAPRVLSGKVTSKAPVSSISIRLRRTYRGHCWTYNGAMERFVKVRCSGGSFFKVSSHGSSFSYLLPSTLPPGRYVFEIEASDAAGDHTALYSGSSRVSFRVR